MRRHGYGDVDYLSRLRKYYHRIRSSNNWRWETKEKRSDRGASETAEISLDGKVVYHLDLKARQYVELHMPTFPQGPPVPIPRFGTTVDFYYETTYTGETKEFLGRIAKHLILRQPQVVEPGACMKALVTETDGWYFPKPENTIPVDYPTVAAFGFVYGGKICGGQMLFHGHPPAVLVVKETLGSIKKELREFSTEPLDRSLFVPPSGFE